MSSQASVPFNVSVRDAVGAVVLDVDGEFDIAGAGAFLACVTGAVVSSDDAVIVDLADVTFIDSAAISALLWARRCLAGEDREFRLQHVTAPVLRVFDLTELTDFFVDDSSVGGIT